MGMFDWFRKTEVKSFPIPSVQWGISGQVEWTDWDFATAVKEGYEASTTVYACVELRSKLVSSVPWLAQRMGADGWEDYPDSELQRLIDDPHPQMSWQRIMRLVSQHLDLAGEAYMHKVRAGMGRAARELWVLDPGVTQPMYGPTGLVELFKYQPRGKLERFPAEDVVYLMNANPRSSVRGMPTLKAAGRATDIDREAEIYQRATLENRGATDLVINVDKDTAPDQLDKLKELFRDNYAGATNAGKPLFTNRDVKRLSQTAAEMDYVQGRKFIRETICTAFGVPPAMIGILENATLANIETARKIIWLDTIVPLLTDIESQLNRQLAKDYGEGVRITYDLTNVEALRDNQAEKIANARSLWGMGVPLSVLNQNLDLGLNLEGVEGVEQGYLSPGLLPVGFDRESNTEPEPTEERSLALLQRLAYGPDNR